MNNPGRESLNKCNDNVCFNFWYFMQISSKEDDYEASLSVNKHKGFLVEIIEKY